MAFRVKALVGLLLGAAALAAWCALGSLGRHWWLFAVYLLAVLLSSGMKVSLPQNESTASVNFLFILLALMQLSLGQAIALAAISVFAQCNFRVHKVFTVVQIAFNVAVAVDATAAASLLYHALLSRHLSAAPALSIAAVAYFLSNTVPVATVMGWTKGESVLRFWAESFAWYLPFYLVGAALSALANFLGLRYGWPTSLLVAPAAYVIYRAYNGQVARLRDRQQHMADMEALHLRTIEGLAMAIEAKDSETHDHLTRVRVYVAEIGALMKLSPPEMQAALTAAVLHDIGKLAVPEYIINKPGKLTPEEFEKMKIHPVVGADILERVRFPYPVVPIVRAHHEWWNGMGYPDGLSGEGIPIGARILTVVDCFDALASDRPYRLAMKPEDAMGVLKSNAGTQFDPEVVAVLEQHYAAIEEKARLEGEKLKPLNTDIAVSRGLAPGAGFAQEGKAAEAPRQDGGFAPSAPKPGRTLSSEWTVILERAESLKRMTASPDCTLTLHEAALLLASSIGEAVPFDCFVLYRRRGDELAPEGLSGDAARFFSNRKIAVGSGISGWVALSCRPIVNGNAQVEPHLLQSGSAAGGLRTALSVPLLGVDGAVFAVFTLYSKAHSAFDPEQLRNLESAAPAFSTLLQNAACAQARAKQASSEPVSAIANTAQGPASGSMKESSRPPASDLNAFQTAPRIHSQEIRQEIRQETQRPALPLASLETGSASTYSKGSGELARLELA